MNDFELALGVQEARIHFGPGYRIYFGLIDQQLVLLLAGGSKKSQKTDVKKAQSNLTYWKEKRG